MGERGEDMVDLIVSFASSTETLEVNGRVLVAKSK